MICKALEAHVTSMHGAALWDSICAAAGFEAGRFEPLLTYDDALFDAVLAAGARSLDRDEAALLDDLGAWICTHPPLDPVRRLLRFCGTSFRDFLFSLEEIDARARMTLPELELPRCRLTQDAGPDRFVVSTLWHRPGSGALLAGVLRAMASEHGALAVIAPRHPNAAAGERWECVTIDLPRERFHSPRAFALVRMPR
jgi:hypothetical protein